MDNTDETWGSNSTNKGNDGVSARPLRIFLWFYLHFFKFRLAKTGIFFHIFSLEYAFDSSSTKLNKLVALAIILLFCFGP